MNKPTLTKEQAKAMEEIIEAIEDPSEYGVFDSKVSVIQYKLSRSGFSRGRRAANELADSVFIDALYYGWEVEQTPEEKVREYYERSKPVGHHCEMQPGDFKVMAIKHTLNLLGIKIEGVND
jgi:hypothetical protein